MTVFPDTTFLCSVYREQLHSARADSILNNLRDPLPISSFLALEFRQSVRLQAHLFTRDRTKGFSENEGRQMLRDFQTDLKTSVLEIVPADWADVHRIGEELSSKHTRAEGHRLADLLHVATALHLGAEKFLTFDLRQADLAKAEGLAVL